MGNELLTSVLKVCSILNKHSVQYLIVGGTAVALHGYFRLSHDSSGAVLDKHDLDFWYNSTYDNYFRLLNALEELGRDVTEFKNESAPNPKKSFFRFEEEYFTMDFLPELPGLPKFRLSFENRTVAEIENIEVPYIGYEDLLKSKLALGREKDLDDIEQLKKVRNQPGE
jgi:predicted nucleotidyltransferase